MRIRILSHTHELREGSVLARTAVIEVTDEVMLAPMLGNTPMCVGLTKREKEVSDLIHLSNKEIASHLNIAERTIKFHVSSLLQKTHLQSRYELIRYFQSRPTLETPDPILPPQTDQA